MELLEQLAPFLDHPQGPPFPQLLEQIFPETPHRLLPASDEHRLYR